MPEIHPIFTFEVAQSIDLDQTERVLAGAERPAFRHRGRATSLFQYRPAPLRVAVEGARLTVGRWQTDAVVDLVLFDFGAASVAYSLPVDGDLDELREASAHSAGQAVPRRRPAESGRACCARRVAPS